MKINEPITDHEIKLQNGQELVTKTNLKGVITETNSAFIEISGFSRDELVGKNHNVVRHPDMPSAAFKDLWETLKLGRPWTKLVKNRCKNGDYYWVKAHVTPVFRNGNIVEYMSVRTCPTAQEIELSEKLYAQLKNEEAVIPSPSKVVKANLIDGINRYGLIGVACAVLVNIVVYLAELPAEALMLGPAVAFFVMLFGAQSFIVKNVIQPLHETKRNMLTVSEGDYLVDIPVEEAGEAGELKRSVKMLAVKLGFEVNDAKEVGRNAQRIKVALDNVSSNVMLADNNGDIIYVNDAAIEMMSNAQSDIQTQLPDFEASEILGSNFDIFHKNPEHQRSLLESLKTTFDGKIKVGLRSFRLIANPVVDEHADRLGTVVEWTDITAQLTAEASIGDLIEKASQGELGQRLDTQLYSGFMKSISTGVNEMLDAVVQPLQELKRVLEALAEGDLTQKMNGNYHGDFLELNTALNTSIHNLANMVSEIRGAGTNISMGSSEISTGNATLSQRTESQAASLEQTAASMEEMTSTVRQNADNAQEARNLAAEARVLAKKGGSISKKVEVSMGDISASSRKIAEIIGVIDEIAFQTNLLALNAAVEAARAGEQGRGFAVVASEVRNLAQRSAGAAKEIKELINDSVKKVEEGGSFVDESGKALVEIMESIENVTVIVSEIAAASREQATGIEQVNVAVTKMDEGTQQNAALVEEVAAASSFMEEQAGQLQQLVSAFNITEDTVANLSTTDYQQMRKLAAQGSVSNNTEQQKRTITAKSSKFNPILGAGLSNEEWEEF
jgi:methyl-accepting chemotaxis protein